MPQQSIVKGALLILAAEGVLAMMAGIIKHLSNELPSEQIVFFRNFFGLVFLLPLLLRHGTSELKTQHLRLHLLRAATGICAMYGFFYSIAHLPLAEAAIVKLTTPFFLPIIAYLWLNENINKTTRWSILVGFIGALFILRPGSAEFSIAALVGLGAAFLASFAKVTIRRMSATESSARIVFYFSTVGTLVTIIPAAINWETPGNELWLWIIALGIFGTIGQLLMTRAYQVAKPGQIGPYVYSSVVYASLIGWFIWGELMALTSLVGCILIIGAGMINVLKAK